MNHNKHVGAKKSSQQVAQRDTLECVVHDALLDLQRITCDVSSEEYYYMTIHVLSEMFPHVLFTCVIVSVLLFLPLQLFFQLLEVLNYLQEVLNVFKYRFLPVKELTFLSLFWYAAILNTIVKYKITVDELIHWKIGLIYKMILYASERNYNVEVI